MSVLNQSGEEQVECPLCMEPLEVDDLHFYPCTCGYQICRFCWNRIREGDNGLCPACRKAYPENPADFTPLSQEQVAAIKTEKKAREQKRRNKTLESRRALANVRVVQNNLVFVVGLPVRLADPEILKRQEYFGKYGKIHKVVINQSTTYAGSQGPSASAYVTYVTSADALRAIQGVNNVTLDGRVLKGSLGTTKYCANFMKNQPCPKPDCMYLHELGDPKASFTKEEMHAGLHQVYERKLHNALIASSQRVDDKQPSSTTGNTSTNADKGGSKDGNQSNFIPTTVVTSSHINVVNSSRSKKESNGGGSSGSSTSSGSGKDAWPSLSSSPPADTPPKQPSPQPHASAYSVKSQENGNSESSSPTQNHAASKNVKEHTDSAKRHKDTNGKKNKSTDKAKKNGSHSNNTDTDQVPIDNKEAPQISSVFENEQSNFLTHELDELESDRHSLLENHDLLDNSDHSLLEDDTHSLLNNINNEALMMQRHREMLNLVDNNLMKPMVNGYGLLDRDMYLNERPMNQGLLEQKEMLLRERSRSEMLMRQNELLARQHAAMMEPKHYMPAQSIPLDSATDLLGANYHPNHNMLPFGMRVDNSIAGSSLSSNQLNNINPLSNSIPVNSLSASALGSNSMGMGPMAPFMHNQQMLQQNMQQSMQQQNMQQTMQQQNMQQSMQQQNMQQSMQQQNMQQSMQQQNMQQSMQQQSLQHSGLVNGFDGPQNNTEGRYLAENMDKFFTDFHKAQQMRQLLGREQRHDRHTPLYRQHMLSAERLEQQHRMGGSGSNQSLAQGGARACGDADDDLDFDPFKETQKALAEMMETELMQTTSGDKMERVRRSRLPPPGFGHVNVFQPRPHHHHQDWTTMDPAIMSTSVSKQSQMQSQSQPQPQSQSQHSLSQQQQQLFARFNQLGVNGTKVSVLGGGGGGGWAGAAHAGGWGGARVPLPPGFAPQPAAPHHPPECIDAK